MVQVSPVASSDPQVVALLDALTAELAVRGYTPEQTFGFTAEQLQAVNVYFVGARVDGSLIGVGGLELQGHGVGELKRFFVMPAYRGSGVADAVLDALLDHAHACELDLVRLETGDKQHAAIAFYRRRGFSHIPRFGPYRASQTSVCMQRLLERPEPQSPPRT